jgi:hypothetical protein
MGVQESQMSLAKNSISLIDRIRIPLVPSNTLPA